MGADSLMAWTSVSTWVVGEICTAALLNAQVRDNQTTLRAGGLNLSGQTANDFLPASSSTQLGRVTAVVSKFPFFNGTSWEMRTVLEMIYPIGTIYKSVTS